MSSQFPFSIAGDDYNATTVVLTFMSGAMERETQTVNIPVVDDNLVERTEGLNVELVVGGMSADSDSFGIFDNDGKLKNDYTVTHCESCMPPEK